MTAPARPKVLFYVQHLLGIGHLARAWLVAEALRADGFEVTLALGGQPVPGFPVDSYDVVRLPAVRAGAAGFSELVDVNGEPVSDAFMAHRRDLLLETFDRVVPDVLITEAYPFGRRQMRFELRPLIERAAARSPRPLIACSIRDILQTQSKPERVTETLELVRDFFDLVLVHGDRDFVPLERSYPDAASIADRLAYTGLVAGPVPPLDGPRADVVVSAGGGAAGRALIEAAAGAVGLTRHTGLTWLFLPGINADKATAGTLSRIAGPNVTVTPTRRDFRAVLAAARLSVSQAGYNTVCDLLATRCRAVLVPFSAGGETEQGLRAEVLAGQGRAAVIDEAKLSAEALARLIDDQLDEAGPLPGTTPDLDGARGTARILRRWLGGDR